MANLPFEPTLASNRIVQPRVLIAPFGDGYTQRVGDSINIIKDEWSVTFTALDTTTADTLVEFLEDHAVDNFTWVPFRQTVAKKFICKQFSESYQGNSLTEVSATLEQVFDRS